MKNNVIQSLHRYTSYQQGTAYVGYIIGLTALLTGLLSPVFNGKSAVDLLADAMKQEHAGYSYAVSSLRLIND